MSRWRETAAVTPSAFSSESKSHRTEQTYFSHTVLLNTTDARQPLESEDAIYKHLKTIRTSLKTFTCMHTTEALKAAVTQMSI